MKYAYYPGCSSRATGTAFEMSGQYVAKKVGMELVEIPDWNCCGASSGHVTGHDLAMALPARNLAKAERLDEDLDVVVGCAACYARLKSAKAYADKSEENRKHLEDLMELPYEAKSDVFCLLDAFSRPDMVEKVKELTTKSLKGLKVASYYGCLLVRPAGIAKFDDTEDPQSMDTLMKAIGAEAVDWAFKTECCGASHQVVAPKLGKDMVEKILNNAQANGAEVIVTACPLCMLNLDMREKELNKKRGHNYDMPVFFFTELIAMAFGAEAKEVGVDKHFIPSESRVIEAQNKVIEEKPKRAPRPAAKPAAPKPVAKPVETPAVETEKVEGGNE